MFVYVVASNLFKPILLDGNDDEKDLLHMMYGDMLVRTCLDVRTFCRKL